MLIFDSGLTLSEDEIAHVCLKRFHLDRVEKINNNQLPSQLKEIPLSNKPARLIIHIASANIVRNQIHLPAKNLSVASNGFRPLSRRDVGNHANRYNSEGYLISSMNSYVQLYRNGLFEGVIKGVALPRENGAKVLGATHCEEGLIIALDNFLSFAKLIKHEPPFWIFASLAGCEGAKLKHIRVNDAFHEHTIDQALVTLPELKLPSFEINSPEHLQPMMDVLWNAGGMERSLNYDPDGTRNPCD